MHKKNRRVNIIKNIFLCGLTFCMLYLLIWMFLGRFKSASEVFDTSKFFPTEWHFENYTNAWKAIPGYTFGRFFLNSFFISGLIVVGSLISCTLAAYPFARLEFKGKKLFFACVIASIILPTQILLIPRFIMFSSIGWTDSFKPLIVPSFFCQVYGGFCIYMLVQFMRSIPNELEEAAIIDGCGMLRRLLCIIVPNCKPALFTIGIFSFIWSWDDFLNQLIYLNSVGKYTVSLALRMFNDTSAVTSWGQLFAASILTLIPVTLVYAFAQKYFVEGISTTGLK